MVSHAAELKRYGLTKSTIPFPINKPLPAALVKKLVRARIAEIESASKKDREGGEGNRMGKVVFNMTVSLDGFVAGPNDSPENSLGDGGVRLFDHIGTTPIELECIRAINAPGITHLGFHVVK